MDNSLDRDLMIVLHDVARLLRTRFDQRAREHGMTRAQWVILARLDRQPGISQNEMAALCEVEPITIGRLVDRLEARDLVERRHDPTDRRIRRLHLLPAARPLLEEISHYRIEANEEMLADVPPETRETIIDTLLAMKEKLTTNENNSKLAEAGE